MDPEVSIVFSVQSEHEIRKPLLSNEDDNRKKIIQFVKVIIALLVVQTGWAGFAIILKEDAQGGNINPLIFSMYRDTLCFPLIFVAACIVEGFQRPKWKHIPVFALLGFLMFTGQLCFILGLYYTSAPNASIFQQTIPCITALFSVILRLESVHYKSITSWAKFLGIFCAAGGSALMILTNLKGGSHSAMQEIMGDIFLLVGTTSGAFYIMTQKYFVWTEENNYPPISVTAWIYGFGMLCMLISSSYYAITDIRLFKLTTGAIFPLGYSAVISSGLCYVLVSYAVKHTSSTVVTAFSPVQVPTTILLAYFLFGTKLDAFDYVGGLCIILGLFLVCWSKYKEEEKEKLEQKIHPDKS